MTEEVQSVKKDKQKVTEEVWTSDMLKTFLVAPAPSEDEDDFRRLLFAYRGMTAEAFDRYLDLFLEAGFNLGAKDHQGRDFLMYLKRFQAHAEYATVFEKRVVN